MHVAPLAACVAYAALMLTAQANTTPADIDGEVLSFIEPNRGQASSAYAYIARASTYTVLLSANDALFLMSHSEFAKERERLPQRALRTESVRMRLVGARADIEAAPAARLAGRSTYLRGSDPEHWLSGIPHYRKLRFSNVYPGVDLIYTLADADLRYDFVVTAQAHVEQIRIAFDAAAGVGVDANGALHVRSSLGELVHSAPQIYEEREGQRRPLDGGFVAQADGTLRFHVAQRDPAHALVIDPTVRFATYLGGSGADAASAIALDAAGRLLIAGSTSSLDLPTDAPRMPPAGGVDVFVARLAADGQTLDYVTYIGGSGDDYPGPLELDPDANAIVGGRTTSSDFPVVNAAQPVYAGGTAGLGDGFLLKLAATGDALIYATYLGGSDPPAGSFGFQDEVRGLAVDALGNAFVTGPTSAEDFPATRVLNGRGCLENEMPGRVEDVYVAKLAPDGTLLFATCLGGTMADYGRGLALGPRGSIYLTGHTRSLDYPVTPTALQSTMGGGSRDIYVTRLNAAATAITYSTYVGGLGDDLAEQVRVGPDGSAVVVGFSYFGNFPTTPNAFQPDYHGPSDSGADAVVFKLAPGGSNLVFSTYLGGSGDESGWGLDLDAAGHIYVGGTTSSDDFPLATPVQANKGAPAAVIEEIGVASDDTLALASGLLLVNGDQRPIVVAGNGGVDRVYEFQVFDGPLLATVDLGTAPDHTRAVALFDGDLDGYVDAVVVGNDDAPSKLYRSDGSGGFLPAADIDPQIHRTRALVVAQVRGADTPDLIVGNYGEPNLYYPGSVTGFEPGVAAFPGSASTATMALAVGDVNGDGRADVVEGNDGQPNRLYLATATAFAPGVAIGPEADVTTAIVLGDVDFDGDADVITGNVGAPNRLYRNRGDGTFDTAEDLDEAPATTTGLLLTDLNYDGPPELLTSDGGGGWAYVNDQAGHYARTALTSSQDPANALAAGQTPMVVYRATPAGAPLRRLNIGFYDAYAAVLDPSGSRLLFSTYVGGGGEDYASWGLRSDDHGNLYVAGSATNDFPTVSAVQPLSAGGGDAFVAMINVDADDDGWLDGEDNCTEVANPDQRDTNADGFGNVCDADLDNDCSVNFLDLGLMKSAFFSGDPDADLDGDGSVNFLDLGKMKSAFFLPPGPSGTPNICAAE